MRTNGIGGHTAPYRGARDEWLTPPEILEALGPFDLDPCAPEVRPWPMAAEHLTVAEDGLSRPWAGRVWLNPPYGPQTWRWLRRLRSHGNGVALTFARTETAGFFAEAWTADALLFLRGRLHFYDVQGRRAKGNAGGPSVLLAYGDRNVETLGSCGIPGALVVGHRIVGEGVKDGTTD
jgi:hypothetical protein